MLEVEMKFPLSDWTALIGKITEWGAVALPVREDKDHYFNAPDRDFAKTDEAVRLRRIGDKNYFTYKGPKLDSATKTRKEIELPLGKGNDTAADGEKFLTSLGFRPVAVVTKVRQVYQMQREGFDVEICLDDVANVGKYVEVEILAEPSDLDKAKAVLLQMADELGLKNQQRKSYLGMLLEAVNSQ